MKMLSLAFRDAVKSKNSILLFFGIVMAAIFPIIIYMITNSFMVSADEKASELYGYFDNILYMAAEDIETAEKINYDEYLNNYADSYGIVNIYEAFGDNDIIVGDIDDEAKLLGCVHLIEGNYPENKNEIAVCNSLLYKNKWNNKIGDTIVIGDNKFILAGIINDYAALWNKPIDAERILLPNVLISKDNIEKKYEFIYQQHLLIKNKKSFSENKYMENSNLISNINRTVNNRSEKYKIPQFVIFLTTCCTLLLNIYIFIFYFEAEHLKMSLLRCLALTKRKLMLYITIKILIILVAAVVCSIIAGNGISFLAVKLFNNLLNINNEYIITKSYMYYSIGAALIVVMISLTIVFYKIKKLSPLDIYRRYNSDGENRFNIFGNYRKKTNKTALAFREIMSHPDKVFIYMLLSTFSIALFVTLSVYMNNYASQKADVFGSMPIDFDYEFMTDQNLSDASYVNEEGEVVNTKTLPDDDTIFYLPDYSKLIPDNIIDEIREEKDVYSVNKYLEMTGLYLCNAPAESNNAYLEAFRNDSILSEYVASKFGINGNAREIQYMGYSETEILALKDYVIQGSINIEKIKSGEEVILMAPVYEITDLGEGYYRQDFISYDHYKNNSNQYKDAYYSVGDDLTFVQFYSANNKLQGYLSEEQVDDYLKCNSHSAKIGAIIYERINWFDNASQPPTAYTIIGVNETISNIGMLPDISRMQIYLNNDVTYEEFDSTIRYYEERLSNFMFRNNAAEMQDFREFKLVINSICYLLIGIIFVVMIVIVMTEDRISFENNRRYYGLLHINGLDNRKLVGMIFLKSLYVEIFSVLLAIPLMVVIANYMYGNVMDFINMVNISVFVFIVLFIISISFFSSIISRVLIRRKTIIEMIM